MNSHPKRRLGLGFMDRDVREVTKPAITNLLGLGSGFGVQKNITYTYFTFKL